MKKTTTLVLVLMLYGGIHGQEVISTQGDSHQGTDASIDYTIGEPVIFTGTDGSNSLTQGFHQTKWEYVSIDIHNVEFSASVYPNPVNNKLIIESENFEGKNYSIYDATGKIVTQGKLEYKKTEIPANEWAPGSYSVVLSDNEQLKLRTIKLIKNQ
ncbi:MAG: hypothetical protein COA32_16600 [Fluviicola sp.]|nr:MAG: hypothetical protein COA32_16600 [Fluviicola sp.]